MKDESIKRFFSKDFIKKVYDEAMAEDVVSNAAQVAFYFIFALFPLLLFLLSLFGLVLESAEEFRQELFVYLREIIPASALALIEQTLNEVVQSSSGGKLTFGFLLALWSASAGIDSLRIVLNDVYDLEETRSWWKYKLTCVLVTLGLTVLICVVIGIVFYGSHVLTSTLTGAGLESVAPYIASALSFIVILAAMLLAFACLYAFVPNHETFVFRWITPGAVTAVVLWLAFSFGFRIYLAYFDSYAATYGSVGAIIILLLWLYLTALVILIGGVINSVADKLTEGKEKEVGRADTEEEEAAADDADKKEKVDNPDQKQDKK
ncbi:MAG TPA: YihY/virulence factor BrkB family protein [Pyrinomonadaceae bacterium]|jgi:membrane protein